MVQLKKYHAGNGLRCGRFGPPAHRLIVKWSISLSYIEATRLYINARQVQQAKPRVQPREHLPTCEERVFYDVMDLHRATLIQLVKVGTIDAEAGKKIAKGLAQAIASYDDPTDPASLDYLLLEGRLLELVGPTASFLHTGRSRQDITSTLCQMEARHGARVSANAMLKVRESLLQVAEKHIMTVIPAYTHGVPAQPTTFAHYLLSFHDSMERHYHRMEEAYSCAWFGRDVHLALPSRPTSCSRTTWFRRTGRELLRCRSRPRG